MALAVTQRRLLSLKVGALIGMGMGGKVEGLVSAAPLSDVDSIEMKRLAAGKTITVTVRGRPRRPPRHSYGQNSSSSLSCGFGPWPWPIPCPLFPSSQAVELNPS
jgi:hypothetical protein